MRSLQPRRRCAMEANSLGICQLLEGTSSACIYQIPVWKLPRGFTWRLHLPHFVGFGGIAVPPPVRETLHHRGPCYLSSSSEPALSTKAALCSLKQELGFLGSRVI